MRILAIGINYWPEETGIAAFNTGWCEFLAAAGHEVTVCTGFPYYPAWRVTDGYRRRVFGFETRNGVRVLRSYLYVPRHVTTARRVLHEGTFVASSCLRAMVDGRPDLLFTLSPPLGLGLSSAVLGLLWGIPYVFHVLDLQPDAALELGMLRRGSATEALYAVERLAYRRAALVATLTEPMRARIVAKGVPAEKVVVFPSWADAGLFRVPLAGGDGTFREAAGLSDEFLVVHIGNMGVKQALEVLIETATLSRDDQGIAYLLVGDGAMRERLKQESSVRGLKNLHFLPLQPRAAFLELLAEADVCVVTQQRAVTDIVFPSKLVTLLAAGRPVVASVNPEGEVARVIERSGAGLVVPPEDPKALFDAIRVLRAAGPFCRVMGQRGRAYAAAQWSPARVLPEMEARLLSVMGDGKLAWTQ